MGGDTPEIEVNAMRGKGRFPALRDSLGMS